MTGKEDVMEPIRINAERMKASWLEAVANGEAEGFARHWMPDILDELARRPYSGERAVPWSQVHHLMAMLLRIGLVKMEWFETWHPELHARLAALTEQEKGR